jgi:hypothetical protein
VAGFAFADLGSGGDSGAFFVFFVSFVVKVLGSPISALSVMSSISPPPALFYFLLQTNTLFESTQSWPLHGAWVALGPRLGHPRATQTQTQTQTQGERI